MAIRIVITPTRERKLYRVGPCFFSTFKAACEALHAAQTHRLDLFDLVAQLRASVATVHRITR
jgi:hypothetical protein